MAALVRAKDVLVSQGVGALWFKLLGEVCYRRTFLYKEVLADDLALPAADIPLEVRALTAEEASVFASAYGRVSTEEVLERLDQGHLCHVAWSEGRVAGCVWSAPGHAPIDYLSVAMELPPGAVYGYEIWVRPEFRKHGVSIAMICERRLRLLKQGYDVGYSVLMPENTAALGFQRAVKRIRIGIIRVFWLGSWRKAWVRMRGETRRSPFELTVLRRR